MWIGLGASTAGSTAIRVRLDGLDAITGEPWQPRLAESPQNYVVWPAQPWIEGIYRDGRLHSGFSVESAPSLRLELSVYGPRSRRDARVESVRARERPLVLHELDGLTGERSLAGLVMPDRAGLRWRTRPTATVTVYVAAPSTYRDVTGSEPLGPVAEHERYRGERLP